MQRLIVVTMRAFRAVRALRGTSQRCGMAHRVHERAAVSSVTRLYIQQSKLKTLPLRSTKLESSTVIACVHPLALAYGVILSIGIRAKVRRRHVAVAAEEAAA